MRSTPAQMRPSTALILAPYSHWVRRDGPRSIGWLQVGRHAHTDPVVITPGAEPCLLPLLTIALCLPSGVMGHWRNNAATIAEGRMNQSTTIKGPCWPWALPRWQPAAARPKTTASPFRLRPGGAARAGAGAPGHGGQGLVDCADGGGQPVSVNYLDFPQPERGFYRFATDPPRSPPPRSPAWWQTASGSSHPGRFERLPHADLPSTYLTKLNTGFANLRKQGPKAVVRFAYNYPETESDYLNAQDATLSRVKRHITQLQPVLQANADVIAAVQGGFIGAWGEWHTSSNKLTTPANKAAVRDALLQAVPASRQLQVRYPGDLAAWFPATHAGTIAGAQPHRCGAHWPAQRLLPGQPPDDVGHLLGQHAPAQSAALRTYAQQASATTSAGAKPAPHPWRPRPA